MSKRNASKKPTDLFFDFANKCNYVLPAKLIDPNNQFEKLRSARSKISEIQTKLRKLLDGIIKEEKITDSEELQFFTKICKQYRLGYKASGGRLVERRELGPARKWNWLAYSEWLHDLSFSLIGSLSDPKKKLRRIKKCVVCGQYFISRTIKRVYCYEDDCKEEYKRNYHREDMRKRRDPDSKEFDSRYV